jgi:hypothetical protein
LVAAPFAAFRREPVEGAASLAALSRELAAELGTAALAAVNRDALAGTDGIFTPDAKLLIFANIL